MHPPAPWQLTVAMTTGKAHARMGEKAVGSSTRGRRSWWQKPPIEVHLARPRARAVSVSPLGWRLPLQCLFLARAIKHISFLFLFWAIKRLFTLSLCICCGFFHSHQLTLWWPPNLGVSLSANSTFVPTGEPLLTHNHSESIVCIRTHSGCCIFCGSIQMYNEGYLSLGYPTGYFHCPR